MSDNDSKSLQQKLIKGRKAARFTGVMAVFGGVVLLLYGIFTAYYPTVLNGAVFATASIIPFVAAKMIEKKLDKLQV
jgi:hypothetical protein